MGFKREVRTGGFRKSTRKAHIDLAEKTGLDPDKDSETCRHILIGYGTLPIDAEIADANRYFDTIDRYCPSCPYYDVCPIYTRGY